MSAPAGPPPGWYLDQQGVQRWWDGQRWTEHVAPPPAPPAGAPLAVTPPDVLWRQGPVFWWIAACAVAIIVGGFGPWVVVRSVLSVSGVQRDGPFLIAGGFVIFGMLWIAARSQSRVNAALPLAAAIACTVLSAIDTADVFARGRLYSIDASPGWGLYLCLGASLAASGLSVVLLVRGVQPHRR